MNYFFALERQLRRPASPVRWNGEVPVQTVEHYVTPRLGQVHVLPQILLPEAWGLAPLDPGAEFQEEGAQDAEGDLVDVPAVLPEGAADVRLGVLPREDGGDLLSDDEVVGTGIYHVEQRGAGVVGVARQALCGLWVRRAWVEEDAVALGLSLAQGAYTRRVENRSFVSIVRV